MKIINVTQDQYFHYIPIKGLDAVEKALEIYAGRQTTGSSETEREQMKAIGKSHGGLGLGLYLLGSAKASYEKGSFVQEQIMKDARKDLVSRDRWQRGFDYDGMGTVFFKTTVEIDVLDRALDLYGLGLYAAYVGDKVEVGLSERLNIQRALIWASVVVETEPEAGIFFRFDFENLMSILCNTLGIETISGEQAALAMMKLEQFGDSDPNLTLYQDGEFQVTLKPGTVKRRFNYIQGRKHDTWESRGSVVKGDLEDDYLVEGKKQNPTIVVKIRSSQNISSYLSMPIWNMETIKRALDLRDTIAGAINPTK